MRFLCACRPAIFPALALLLLLLSPAAAVDGAHAAGVWRNGATPSSSSSLLLAPLAWLRSSVCQFLYGTEDSAVCGGDGSSSGSGRGSGDLSRHPPWERVARSPQYGKQTVVRFRISTADEEAALAEAATRLFLDVWSFDNATGTVDIRLDRDGIAPLLSLLPTSLQQAYTHLVPDLATAVWDTYPTRGASGRGRPAKPALVPSAASSRLTDASAEHQQHLASLIGGGGGGGGTDNIFFRDYQPYPVIVQWMRLLDVMFPFVNMISVGETAEGREILGLRVGTLPRDDDDDDDDGGDGDGDDGDDDEEPDELATKEKSKHGKKAGAKHHKSKDAKKKPAQSPRDGASWDPEDLEEPEEPEELFPKRKTILITGGMHAREWISSSSVSYVAWSILSGYGKEHMITKLVDHFDLVFVPVMNPDGYEYTWQTDRLWRKTRQSTNFRYCRGYDLDHAFGFQWGRGKSNAALGDEPCSETYGGESAFQAIEAQTLSSWARSEVEQHNVQFVGFLDLHAYSQHILYPFSYSCVTDPPNLENLEELAAGLAKAIRLSTGETYTVSPACESVLGQRVGGGSAIDWFYHEMDAKFSYQIKLRDTGSYGFLLPSSEIVPTGEEVFSAVKYFGDFLLGNNGIEKIPDGGDGSMRTELRRQASWKA